MDSDGGGDSKRRRRTSDHGNQGLQRNDHEDEDDDVSEDEKMKAAFFELIQAARGAREQLFGRNIAGGDNDKSRRQPATMPRVWKPTFQASDFVDDPGKDTAKVPGAETGGPSRLEANPGKGEGKGDEDEGRMKRDVEGNDGGLNLKLSL